MSLKTIFFDWGGVIANDPGDDFPSQLLRQLGASGQQVEEILRPTCGGSCAARLPKPSTGRSCERDDIIYAERKSRDTYTRFTKSQPPQPCSTVTLFLSRLSDEQYELGSAWIGYLGPSFPGDANESPESRPYWNKHALVWGRQEIQTGSETNVCPW
jgi:hypothetical protein